MGQKINSNIFRLGTTVNKKEWDSNFFEKNSEEHTLYNFNFLEVRRYIIKYLADKGIFVHNLKIKQTEKTFFVFVTFFVLPQKNLKLYEESSNQNKKNLNYRYNYWKNSVFRDLLESISFFQRKRFNVNLITQKLNLTMHRHSKKRVHYNEKNQQPSWVLANSALYNYKGNGVFNKNIKSIIRKYKRKPFLKNGLIVFLVICRYKNSSSSLANFIAYWLNKTSRHYFFVSFVKKLVSTISLRRSVVSGLVIQIKGRFNRKLRAKKRILKLGDVPVSKITAKISYAESTSFTRYGTMGVKVWINEN